MWDNRKDTMSTTQVIIPIQQDNVIMNELAHRSRTNNLSNHQDLDKDAAVIKAFTKEGVNNIRDVLAMEY